MGEARLVYAIAESCPLDAALVRNMRLAVNSLLQLNLRRFRVPEKTITKYSALDIMKQALELLFEFSPSERNYREAMRTIQVYSEGDTEMYKTLRSSFMLIANAVYNAYAGQRKTESIGPKLLFLQGIPINQSDLQQSFRYVGVKPPNISTTSVERTVFLDEGFQPYSQFLDGKLDATQMQTRREEHWAKVVESGLSNQSGPALMRVGAEHVQPSTSRRMLNLVGISKTGKLPKLLSRKGIKVEVVQRVEDVNRVFGKD